MEPTANFACNVMEWDAILTAMRADLRSTLRMLQNSDEAILDSWRILSALTDGEKQP